MYQTYGLMLGEVWAFTPAVESQTKYQASRDRKDILQHSKVTKAVTYRMGERVPYRVEGNKGAK